MDSQPEPLSPTDGEAEDAHSLPREPRSNILLMATLYSDAGSAPVRVRNLSRCGALLEGAVLPPPGARVRLCRGSLQVSGAIVWNRDGRAGARFESTLTVADWLPRGVRPSDQQRVDEMLLQARSAPLAPAEIPAPPASAPAAALDRQLEDVREAIDLAAETLASDPFVARSCAGTIQRLDEAARVLRALIDRMGGPGDNLASRA